MKILTKVTEDVMNDSAYELLKIIKTQTQSRVNGDGRDGSCHRRNLRKRRHS